MELLKARSYTLVCFLCGTILRFANLYALEMAVDATVIHQNNYLDFNVGM